MATGSPNWQTIGGSTMTYTLSPEPGGRPEKTPQGLITTRAVETQAGWVGQVIVDTEIVYETPLTSRHIGEDAMAEAMQEANSFVVERVKALFTDNGVTA